MKANLLILFSAITFVAFSQNFDSFEGKFIYQVDFSDSLYKTSKQTSFMTIYTNDTLVRVEAESNQLGKQVTIRHLILNKYYILLEVNNTKFAIQHLEVADSLPSRYQFKKKCRSKKFDGQKAKKILVSGANFTEAVPMYYFKNLSPKYLEALKGMPGLAAEFYIQNEDGVYHYRLVDIEKVKIPKDFFGVPVDYKKVTFDEFMESMMQKTNN